MANMFLTPKLIVSGDGALEASSENLKSLGNKALVVTDSMMVKLGNLDRLTNVLDSTGIEYAVYSEIDSEPCDYMIEKGANIYRENACDFLISIGGGSPIDSMKAIAAVVTYNCDINDFMGKVITKQLPNMCAIPTTAGTGSEATQIQL